MTHYTRKALSMNPTRLTLGIIGYGNMGSAIAAGVMKNPLLTGSFAVLAYDPHERGVQKAQKDGVELAQSAIDLATRSDLILLAVKPDQAGAAVRGIATALSSDKLLISIAAGITTAFLAKAGNGTCPVVRVMPNTPALVGKGIFGFCFGEGVSQGLQDVTRMLFGALGTAIEIPEKKMDAFTALSGSGPGYVFHFMESLAEAGVSAGLDRESSSAIATALLQGCAEMAESTGTHFAVLREQVSSPAGTTLAGLNHLDRSGARGMLIDAVLAAVARGKELEKESRNAE